MTIKKLAESVAEAIGFEGEIIWDHSKHDGTPKKQLSVVNLKNLGWSSSISLEIGLKDTCYLYENLTKSDSAELRS